MKKHCTFGKKIFVIAVEMLSVLSIIGIIYLIFTRCIITTDKYGYGYSCLINPFADEEYEESEFLATMFDKDASNMIYYLALCRQFETNGEFDKEKTIDLLEYYYRRHPEGVKVSSGGTLEYKVQDLINWGNTYGVNIANGNVEEVYYPTDGISIYEKNMADILIGALPEGIYGFEQSEKEENQEVNIETFSLEETTGELTVIEETRETDSVSEVQENSEAEEQAGILGEDEQKIQNNYEEDLMSRAYEVYGEILMSVISDLNLNYERYQNYKEVFGVNKLNFKYLYIPDKGREYFSNLNIKNRSAAKKMAEYFNENMDMAAYAVIEPATKNIVIKSPDITLDSLFEMLGTMGYSFREDGGTIYLGVLKNDIEGFADYDTGDYYAAAQRAYRNFHSDFQIYVVLVGVLFLLAVVSFVLYSCMCGNKAWYETIQNEDKTERRKLVIEEQPVLMRYFDKWFTEIAFAVAVLVLGAVLAAFCLLAKIVLDSDNALYLLKSRLVFIAVLGFVGIFNGVLLFFYGSLVRRIKVGTLWKGSLFLFLLRAIKKAGRKIKDFFTALYYNRGVVFRMCAFYFPFMLADFILIVMGSLFGSDGDMDMCLILYFMALIANGMCLYFICKNKIKHQEIIEGIEKINGGELGFQLDTTQLKGDNLRLADAVNHIGTGIKQAVETSMKDERLKSDLITNVSHDIKTPLTSIINYVDLLKRENVQDDTIREYIEVLDVKSQRLKQLTEDLVEASKISSGNITLVFEKLNVVELMNQIIGEFSEKFQEKNLNVVTNFMDRDSLILADGRRMWRVFENLLGNIYKYAMPGTRVYLEVYQLSGKVYTAIKNISEQPLNIDAEELTERFIRGDISRSTEGSGLGLSIAKSLVEAQKGEFKIYLDGDLFKVTVVFPKETSE